MARAALIEELIVKSLNCALDTLAWTVDDVDDATACGAVMKRPTPVHINQPLFPPGVLSYDAMGGA